MPTGYTQPLYDGEAISFEQFALRCARGVGAAIMQRDEPLDAEIRLREVSGYATERLEKAVAALSEGTARTNEEWAILQTEEIQGAQEYSDECKASREALAARYGGMLARVREWEPPTEEHQGLKKFMVDQLTESLKFDAGSFVLPVPVEVPAEEYRERELGRLAREVERATVDLAAERERVRSQNAWVTALRESLAVSV